MRIPYERFAGATSEAKYRPLADVWRVRADQALPPRIAKTAIIGALKVPSVRRFVHEHIAAQFGETNVLGAGYQQLVIANGERVRKLILGTASLPPTEIEEYAGLLERFNSIYADALSEAWLTTDYEILTLGSDVQVLVANQPRLPKESFVPRSIEVAPTSQTARAARQILEVYEQETILPDILGNANVAIRDTGVTITDSIPAHKDEEFQLYDPVRHMSVMDATLQVLEAWQQAA